MTKIAWEESLRIGVGRIDRQHQHLFDLLNTVDDCLTDEAPRDNIQLVFNELLNYITYHFDAEEALMSEANYPELAHHRRAHAKLAATLHDLFNEFNANPARDMGAKLHTFLSDWLIHHIKGEDVQIGPWLFTHEISEE